MAVVAKGWGGGNGELVFNADSFSLEGEKSNDVQSCKQCECT